MERVIGPVAKGNKLFYLDFTATRDYDRNVIKGYTSGCNLNCSFCWSMTKDYLKGETRFIPPRAFESIEKTQGYYSPEEVMDKIKEIKISKKISELGKFEDKVDNNEEINWFEIAGGEPTIAIEHLFGILSVFKKASFNLLLLTNGIILGKKREVCKKLAKYKDIVQLNIGIKAGNERGFTERARAPKDLFELPFKAITNLKESGFDEFSVSVMSDPRLMDAGEKEEALLRIREAGYKLKVNEEEYVPYYASTYRIKEAGGNFDLRNLPWKGVYK